MPYQILLYPLFAWMLATTCLAQVQTQLPSRALGAPDAPGVYFKQLHDYFDSSPLEFQTSFEARSDILGLGLRGSVRVLLLRPNLFRMETTSARSSYVLISDGKVLTIYDPRKREFAQLPTPKSFREAVNLFTGLRSIEPVVIDFLGIVEDVAAGAKEYEVTARGSGAVGGRQCDRFTIKQATDGSSNLVAKDGRATPLQIREK